MAPCLPSFPLATPGCALPGRGPAELTWHRPLAQAFAKMDRAKKEAETAAMKQKYNIEEKKAEQ